MSTDQYGDRYSCIGLADKTEVHCHADRLEVAPSGALQAWRADQTLLGSPRDSGRSITVRRSWTAMPLPSIIGRVR